MSATEALPTASPVPRAFLDEAETLTGALATLSEEFPGYECLTVVDRQRHENRVALGALWSRARDVHATLAAGGLTPGGFVLLALPTGPELIAAYVGVLLAGGIPGLIATPAHRFSDSGVYAQRLHGLAEHANAHTLYVDEGVVRIIAECDIPFLRTRVVLTPSAVLPTSCPPSVVHGHANTVATVQYSSGSTGAPKGVLLSNRAILNNLRAMRDGLALCADDISVNWLPLYHDMGLIDAFLMPLLIGCQTVLIPTMDFMRDPSLWLWAIHRYRGTISIAPNFAYTLCAKRIVDAELAGLDLSSWRLALNASEPILAPTLNTFIERFAAYGLRPSAMTPAWGLAEAVCVITARPVDAAPLIETIDRQQLATENVARPTTADGLPSVACGRCLPGSFIEIRDPDGQRLSERQVGTIWLKSDSLFSGYHREPQLTAQVFVDGWLNTGDRGYLSGGELYFVSREKDLIVVGGEKYAPHDVEAAINHVEGVREGCAAAFGVLSESRGTEEVAAVVETRLTDETALADLRKAIRAEVTRVTGLALRYVILVGPGGVEKTTSGKLARRATQRRYVGQLID